jgi:hypothetical protein
MIDVIHNPAPVVAGLAASAVHTVVEEDVQNQNRNRHPHTSCSGVA